MLREYSTSDAHGHRCFMSWTCHHADSCVQTPFVLFSAESSLHDQCQQVVLENHQQQQQADAIAALSLRPVLYQSALIGFLSITVVVNATAEIRAFGIRITVSDGTWYPGHINHQIVIQQLLYPTFSRHVSLHQRSCTRGSDLCWPV